MTLTIFPVDARSRLRHAHPMTKVMNINFYYWTDLI